jgi:preprotein translocase subunit YajC
MFDLNSLFISTAIAQEAAPAADTQSALVSYIPFILIFAVFYFLVIRPQQRKLADQDKMVKSLQKGDRVITSGGIHGKVAKVEEGMVMLEIAEGVQIQIDADNILGMEAKPQVADKQSEKKA